MSFSIQEVTATARESETPARIPIHKPNGDPYKGVDGQDAYIDVYGAESKRVRDAEARITRRNLRNRKPIFDEADLRRNRIERSAAAVAGWNAEGETAGVVLECNADNASKLFEIGHILLQVEAGIEGHADFSRASSRKP